ncbi:shikimate kinase, partial [Nocardia abscessus]|uniref:shikimate kinase n=1 Tax=Nocardia abscessus TaxID=120957 RepID=UPI00245763C6
RESGPTNAFFCPEAGAPVFRRIASRGGRRPAPAPRGVVSLGGGAVLSENTRALLRNRTVVYLEISVAEGLRRTGASTQRPLLNAADPGAKYRELMRTRRPLYREVATVRVRTDGRSPGRVVRMIMTRLGMEPAERAEADLRPPPSGIPQGSSRSRARRRARARATSRRKDADQDEPNDTAAGPAPESAVAAVRSRRTRRSVTSEPEAATAAGSGETAGSRSRRARSRRARSRARQQSTTAPTESEQAT